MSPVVVSSYVIPLTIVNGVGGDPHYSILSLYSFHLIATPATGPAATNEGNSVVPHHPQTTCPNLFVYANIPVTVFNL